MDLGPLMDEIAATLDTVTGLQGFGFPPKTIVPPVAVATYPEAIRPHGTYSRGMDTMRLPVIVVVGKVDAKSTRDKLGAYCNGSGTESLIEALETADYIECDSVTVDEITFDVVTIAGTDYMAATFMLDIAGSGA